MADVHAQQGNEENTNNYSYIIPMSLYQSLFDAQPKILEEIIAKNGKITKHHDNVTQSWHLSPLAKVVLYMKGFPKLLQKSVT